MKEIIIADDMECYRAWIIDPDPHTRTEEFKRYNPERYNHDTKSIKRISWLRYWWLKFLGWCGDKYEEILEEMSE